jgi:hypothetical protein
VFLESLSDKIPVNPPSFKPQHEEFYQGALAPLTTLFLFKQTLEKLSSLLPKRSSSFPFADSDVFQFGHLWPQIKILAQEARLLEEIAMRQREITEQKEHWQVRIHTELLPLDPLFYEHFEALLNEGVFIASSEGFASTYFLHDAKEIIRFVVKPVDEDMLCLNNRKCYASPYNEKDFRVREGIPLYRSAQTNALAWEVAKLCGLASITLKTNLVIVKSDAFHSLEQTDIQEKLCCVQEYIPETTKLFEIMHLGVQKGLTDREFIELIEIGDFEKALLFVWLTYDNDAHGANFLTYVKPNGKLGLKKIDNDLSFPEKNKHFINALAYLPHAERQLSNSLKDLIAGIPLEPILNAMRFYEMSACEEAFKERLATLQCLARRDDLTMADIDLRLSLLDRPNGNLLAMSSLSEEELEEILLEEHD